MPIFDMLDRIANNPASPFATPKADICGLQPVGETRQKIPRYSFVNEHRLRGVAGGWVVGLRVVDDVQRHFEIRGPIDINMADTFCVSEYRNLRRSLNMLD